MQPPHLRSVRGTQASRPLLTPMSSLPRCKSMAPTRKHGDLCAFWKDFSPAIAILTFPKPTAARLGACSAFDNPAVTLMIRGVIGHLLYEGFQCSILR